MSRILLIILMALPCCASAQNCKPIALAAELLRRNEVDQTATQKLAADPMQKALVLQVVKIDRENTAYLRTMLEKCGWPKKSLVGETAAKAAWRLTQHADLDPEYQIIASRQLEAAVHDNEAEAWDLAVLVDRNRRLTNSPQVYGMQFFIDADKAIRFFDMVNTSQIDVRRKEIGLNPFYCWALEVSKKNKGASIHWPAGVLFSPQRCPDAR